MNNIEVYDPRPSHVGNAQQSLRQISFWTYEGLIKLGKSVIAVFYSAGRLFIATKLRKAFIAFTTLSLLVASCNFPAEYASPPSPTAPQVVEATEAPIFTPEPLPTSTPTETPAPFEPLAVYVSETEREVESAENPPFYCPWAKEDPIIGVDEEELAVVKASQIYRLYKGEGDKSFWTQEKEFVSDMQDFAKKNPELQILQKQSPDNSSIITFMYNQDTREVLWGFDPQGNITYPRPDFYDIHTQFQGIPLPEGTTPDFCYNQDDGHWYLFAVNDQNIAEAVFLSHQANEESPEEQWAPLSSDLFPESYQTKYDVKYIYEGEDGISFPIHISLAEDIPFNEIHFQAENVDITGKAWLISSHYRYQQMRGNNDVSYEEYIDLVKQGKGQFRAYFLNESKRPTYKMIDPRNGFLLLFTSAKEGLPLILNPGSRPLKHVDLRVNDQGVPALIQQVEETDMIAERDEYVGSMGCSVEVATSWVYDNLRSGAILYWGSVDMDMLLAGGNVSGRGRQSEELSMRMREMQSEYYQKHFDSMSVEELERFKNCQDPDSSFLILKK